MSIILLDDEIVHYEVLGRGRPVIFLHGWVGSWRYWIPSMQSASVGSRAYAIDFWGFGDTAKNSSRYNLEQQLELVDRFIERMGILRTALVGHGLGAVVGILVALHRPEVIDRLMGISLPFSEETQNSPLSQLAHSDSADWLPDNHLFPEAVRAEASKADRRAIQITLDQLGQINVMKLVQQLKLPNVWIQGVMDSTIHNLDGMTLSSLSKKSHFISFEGSGHYPMLDEPVKFNRLLADFLSLEAGEGLKQLQVKEKWKRRVR